MSRVSRRELARWTADQLTAGRSASDVAKHLVAVLTEDKQLGQADFLLADIAWELEQRRALAVGHVVSAQPLTHELEAALTDRIKQVTKADNVLLETEIDKKVIGGVRVETANHVWDHTIARKLAELREVF